MVYIYKKLVGVNTKESNKTGSGATTGGQGKLLHFIHFPWPQVEAALSIFLW
jgi:hypothetical protein